MNVQWGTPTRHAKTDQLGARAFVKVEHEKWPAHYEIDSHEFSSSQLVQRLADLQSRHDRWAVRQESLQANVGVEFAIEGVTYRIVDCTMPPRMREDHVLIVGVRSVVGDQLIKVAGWPLKIHIDSIDLCPSDAEIRQRVQDKFTEHANVKAAHDDFTAKVASKLPRGAQ